MQFNIPDYIQNLVPYLPGKSIEETKREFRFRTVVKLASNENPLGPSPKAIKAAAKALAEAHRYPDGSAFSLKLALSSNLGVGTDSLFIGNGSSEVIDLLVRTYCLAGDSVVTSQAAFIAYKISAQIHGVKTVQTPLTKDLRFDLGAILAAVKKDERVRMVFIANPNNPTGTYVTTDELRGFLRKLSKVRGGSVLAVLDYAYWEYVSVKDLPNPLEMLREFSNVVVLRTFSKIYGLAGFRIGYGIARPQIIAHLDKVRQPFNLNSLALVAAEAALGDRSFVERARKLNQSGMKYWESQLTKLKIPFWPSQGNYLLVNVQRGLGMSGPEVYQECLKKGIILRPVANYGLPEALRISIGTAEENRLAVRVLGELR